MSQIFNNIPDTDTLTASRQPLLDRDESVRSAFSGSSSPSSPVVGQFFFDTDDSKLYQCTVGGESPTWREIPFGNPVAVAQGGTGSTSASAARTALGLGTLATKDATAIDVDLSQSSTGFFRIASGNDAQRPASPVNGMIRYSSTQNTIEGYINGSWQPVGSTTYNNKLAQRFNGAGGTGTQDVTLTSNPGSLNNIDVFFSGVYQQKDQLSLSGLTLTVPVAPVGTGNIEVVYGVPLSIGVPADLSVTAAKLVDGAVTTTKLGDASVATAKLVDSAVTLVKISPAGSTAGYVLTSNGTGSAPSWQSSGISPSSNVQMNSLGVGTAGSGTAGEIRAIANVTAYYSSDASFKDNVRDIPNALDAACAIGGKLFDWTDEYIEEHGGEDGYFIKKQDFGVIGQDVEREFPLGVRRRKDGKLAVDYQKLSALALAAVAQLRAEVRSMKDS